MDGSPAASTAYVPAENLCRWATAQLADCGVPAEDARIVAGSLAQTSLWGIDSHGIARLPHYLRRLRAGSIEPKPKIELLGLNGGL